MKPVLLSLLLLIICVCFCACYSEYSIYCSSTCSGFPSCGNTEFKNETVGATETPNEGHPTASSESEYTIGNSDAEQMKPDNHQDPPHSGDDTNEALETKPTVPSENENMIGNSDTEQTIPDNHPNSPHSGDDTNETIETKPTVPNDMQNLLENKNMCNKCKFVVNNQMIPYANNACFCNERNYVLVPFVTVIKLLGVKVTWIANNIAEIVVNGEEYVLNVNDATLLKKGTNLNCIIPAPGSSIHYQNIGSDLMIDHITFRTIMMIMNINVKVDVSWDDHSIKIMQQV